MRELNLVEINFVAGGKDTPKEPPKEGDRPGDNKPLPDPHDAFDKMQLMCDGLGQLGAIGKFFGAVCDTAVNEGRKGADSLDKEKEERDRQLGESNQSR